MNKPCNTAVQAEGRGPLYEDAGKVLVLGLGNVLFSDEGVGIHAAAALKQGFDFSPSIDILDGGTQGLDLLPFFQDRRRILIIDAVDLRRPPGTTALLHGSEIRTLLHGKLSVHHIGLSDLILAANLTRDSPLEVWLAGIQPSVLEMGLSLSGPVSLGLGTLFSLLLDKLHQWDIRHTAVSGSVRKRTGFPEIARGAAENSLCFHENEISYFVL